MDRCMSSKSWKERRQQLVRISIRSLSRWTTKCSSITISSPITCRSSHKNRVNPIHQIIHWVLVLRSGILSIDPYIGQCRWESSVSVHCIRTNRSITNWVRNLNSYSAPSPRPTAELGSSWPHRARRREGAPCSHLPSSRQRACNSVLVIHRSELSCRGVVIGRMSRVRLMVWGKVDLRVLKYLSRRICSFISSSILHF